MKLAENALPTQSAIAILKSVDMMPPKENDTIVEHYEARDRLIQFQQMSFVCEFDDCLIAYFGEDVTEVQKEALQLIYKTTQPWMLGHVMGELLTLLSNEAFSGKGAVDAAELILTNMTQDGLVNKEQAAQLIINMAGYENKASSNTEKVDIKESA